MSLGLGTWEGAGARVVILFGNLPSAFFSCLFFFLFFSSPVPPPSLSYHLPDACYRDKKGAMRSGDESTLRTLDRDMGGGGERVEDRRWRGPPPAWLPLMRPLVAGRRLERGHQGLL